MLQFNSPMTAQHSTLALPRFYDNVARSAVAALGPIDWRCRPGQWMTQYGIVRLDNFDGCPHQCAAGYVGTNVTNANTATCGGQCPPGHTCEVGSVLPQPCPRGTHMPTAGAGDRTSCIPCAPGTYADYDGSVNCTACLPGRYSEDVGAKSCKPCPKHGYCELPRASSLVVVRRRETCRHHTTTARGRGAVPMLKAGECTIARIGGHARCSRCGRVPSGATADASPASMNIARASAELRPRLLQVWKLPSKLILQVHHRRSKEQLPPVCQ